MFTNIKVKVKLFISIIKKHFWTSYKRKKLNIAAATKM